MSCGLVWARRSDVARVIAALLDAEGFSSDLAPDIVSAKGLLQTRDLSGVVPVAKADIKRVKKLLGR